MPVPSAYASEEVGSRRTGLDRRVTLTILKILTVMKKYVCEVCGWVYDPAVGVPERGIEPGTPFEDLPDDFECPLCGVGKDEFKPEDE